MICTMCGRVPLGSATASLRGEITCVEHPVAGRCVFCSLAHSHDVPAGWIPFQAGQLRCPACQRDAVEDQQQARAHFPRLRDDMAQLGIELKPRVQVRIVDPAELTDDHRSTGVLLALTDAIRTVATGELVKNEIRVARGLPGVVFGRVVAHEMLHAWLAQQGCQLDATLEEGVCELFAYAWLKRHPSPFADALREQMKLNPDPVYGDGFRTVQDAVRRLGLARALEDLLGGAKP